MGEFILLHVQQDMNGKVHRVDTHLLEGKGMIMAYRYHAPYHDKQKVDYKFGPSTDY